MIVSIIGDSGEKMLKIAVHNFILLRLIKCASAAHLYNKMSFAMLQMPYVRIALTSWMVDERKSSDIISG